jgi:hypothetical protein
MATAEDYFPSNYVKCSDLAGKEHVATIAYVKDEIFDNDGKKQKKPVVYFKQRFKPLVCNKTNFLAIADSCGRNTDSWTEKQIILFPCMVNTPGGKMMEAIRVKRVPPPLAVELNDEIPDFD